MKHRKSTWIDPSHVDVFVTNGFKSVETPVWFFQEVEGEAVYLTPGLSLRVRKTFRTNVCFVAFALSSSVFLRKTELRGIWLELVAKIFLQRFPSVTNRKRLSWFFCCCCWLTELINPRWVWCCFVFYCTSSVFMLRFPLCFAPASLCLSVDFLSVRWTAFPFLDFHERF